VAVPAAWRIPTDATTSIARETVPGPSTLGSRRVNLLRAPMVFSSGDGDTILVPHGFRANSDWRRTGGTRWESWL
jgi:hypothetical protein